MDDSHFETLVRSFATTPRRLFVTAATMALVAGTLGVPPDDAAAKRKTGKRKKKRPSARSTAPPPGTTLVLPPPDPCAGVTCGAVPHGMSVCQNGACVVSSCEGDFYDVDGDVTSGCETADDGRNNHTMETAATAGWLPCGLGGSTSRGFAGKIVSDPHPHDPEPEGFDPTTGSTPDFWTVGVECMRGTLDMTIATTGGSYDPDNPCYIFRNFTPGADGWEEEGYALMSGRSEFRAQFGVSGLQGFAFSLTKTCPSTVRETVNYTMTLRARENLF
jgi:hypothetical protein